MIAFVFSKVPERMMSDSPTPTLGIPAWQPITDLPGDWHKMVHEEVAVLSALWAERVAKLGDLSVVNEFNERLKRRWAIETGIIERIYDIDRGITVLLVERGIDAALIPHGATDRPAEEVVLVLEDHLKVLEGLMEFVARRRPLTNHYIREVHQVLTRHQPTCQAIDSLGRLVDVELRRGEWKQLPNNPSRDGKIIHAYCPPEHVQAEMDRWIDRALLVAFEIWRRKI